MRANQLSVAMDMVVQEFDKLAMCKRGSLKSECVLRRTEVRNECMAIPKLNRKQRGKNIAKVRKKLGNVLKLKRSHDIAAANNYRTDHLDAEYSAVRTHVSVDMLKYLTSDSVEQFTSILREAFEHLDVAKVVSHNAKLKKRIEQLKQEESARLAYLEDELKAVKMGFITGEIPMKDFSKKLAEFEAYAF